MELFCGIDIGTSTLKVLVLNRQGEIVAFSQKPYSVMIESVGRAEQQTKDWCLALDKSLMDIKNQCNMADIVSIGFSGQMHGMVLVDDKLKVIRPAIIWMDQRTPAECEVIKQAIKKLRLETSMLNSPAAGMLISSLLWLKKHETSSYKRIHKVMSPKDYLRLYLTGQIFSDHTDASATLAYNVKDKCWASDLLNELELDESFFPTVLSSVQSAGELKSDIVKRYGFLESVYVAAGGGDSAMQLIGNGILKPEIATLNIGTASQLATVINQANYDRKGRLQTWCHGEEHVWYIQGGSLNGGSVLKWFNENVLEGKLDYKSLNERAGKVIAGAEGLLFLPHLAGERSPYINPRARANFIGLTLKHTADDMIRAMMEGVVFNLKVVYEILSDMGISIEKMIASGGGANSEVWRQIQADILNVPIYTTVVDEEAALGAAIVGAVGSGYYKDLHQACEKMVRLNENVTLPNKDNQAVYKSQYERFKQLYKVLNN